jgi:adenylate cyclase
LPEVETARRLAAIMAADVVGYSRLMEANEERTLASLRQLRHEFFDPTVAKHRGRIFKTIGDGFLVEFGSVIDATRCAMEVQGGMPHRNEALPRTAISSSASACMSAT